MLLSRHSRCSPRLVLHLRAAILIEFLKRLEIVSVSEWERRVYEGRASLRCCLRCTSTFSASALHDKRGGSKLRLCDVIVYGAAAMACQPGPVTRLASSP
jgi:hypothetical protein